MDQLNWAGNYRYSATNLYYPETVEQVQQLVARSSKIKVLGTRHSFNGIADSEVDHLSLQHFDQALVLDHERNTVTVGGGITYGWLCRELSLQGYALHNLASLPHISVAGACATATHGSGNSNGNLATAVSAIEMVTADGQVKVLSRERDGDEFLGAVVGLGGLGVVTRFTLDIVPMYSMRQLVYENLPLAELEHDFDDIMSRAYSVSLFTDWRSASFNQVWFKQIVTEGVNLDFKPDPYSITPALNPLHPITGFSAEPCTEQMGLPGSWYERLPHFRWDRTPSAGAELQSEYLVPRQNAFDALRAIESVRETVAPLLQISEVRTVAADSLWMSTCYQQASAAIHFTWHQDWEAVQNLLPKIEDLLAPFAARPHWGKLFTMKPTYLRSLYPKISDFQCLLQSYDPQGKFRNAYLETYIGIQARTEN